MTASVLQNQCKPKHKRIYITYKERLKRYGKKQVIANYVDRIKSRAKEKNLPCTFTREMFLKLWKQQKGRCAYTGRPMLLGINTKTKMFSDSASVDRINPKKGYVDGNVCLCAHWVNSAKGQHTLRMLLRRARDLIAYNSTK